MNNQPAVLGIDLGTSQVKALLCSADGRVLGQGIADYSLNTPEIGWAEIDSDEWWRASGAAVRAAIRSGGGDVASPDVQSLAIVGQMHGLALTDRHGSALRPAIVWLDRRSAAESAAYDRLPQRLLAPLGNRPSPGMAGPIAAWLARHEPQVFRQARWLLQPKDWLRLQLTGEAASDPTDASGTLLFDMERGQWAVETAEAMGLSADLLPPLQSSSEVAGKLRPDAAAHLGLRAGLPVAIGAADTAASLLAAALPGPGWGLLTLGTGGQWVVPLTDADPIAGGTDPTGQTNLFRSADRGAYRLAAAQNVGVALDWVTNILGTSWADLYSTASRAWQEDTPLFQPYLAGERWDVADGEGGAWRELSLAHQRGDLMRGALEGVAFLLRTKLEDLHRVGCLPDNVVIAGGGSRHEAWQQLLGEVFQLPLFTASDPWLSARGATLIAGVATGMYSTWAEATATVAPPEQVTDKVPSPGAQEAYQRWRRSSGR